MGARGELSDPAIHLYRLKRTPTWDLRVELDAYGPIDEWNDPSKARSGDADEATEPEDCQSLILPYSAHAEKQNSGENDGDETFQLHDGAAA